MVLCGDIPDYMVLSPHTPERTVGRKAEKTGSQKEANYCLSKPQILDLAIHSEDDSVLKKQQSTILVLFCSVLALQIPDKWHVTLSNYTQV